MLASFTGTHQLKMDGKGRMSVPADFRRVLEANDADFRDGDLPRFHLLYGPQLKGHLTAYSHDAFARMVKGFEALPQGDKDTKMAIRMTVGQSCVIDIDKDGRIVMPQRQREKIGLPEGGEITLTGATDHFEIWSSHAFDSVIGASMEDWLAEKGEDFDPIQLLKQASQPSGGA